VVDAASDDSEAAATLVLQEGVRCIRNLGATTLTRTASSAVQINMRYISDSEVMLTYVTGYFNFGLGDTTTPAPPAVASMVRTSTVAGGSTSATATMHRG